MLTPEIKTTIDVAYGPPTDSRKLGERLGVVEVEWKDSDVDGMVLPKAQGYKIVLNSNRARSSSSWAHELDHVITQTGALASHQFRGRGASHKQIERLCDKLGAEILMPEDLFRQYMDETDIALTSVPALARTFDTSIESTAIRFAEFLPFPAVLSKWKSVSGHLMHSWSRSNEKCKPCRFDMPRGNTAKHVGVEGHYLALRSNGVVRTQERLSITHLSRIVDVVTRRSKIIEDHKWLPFPTDSMAFGSGDYRYVLSLSYVGSHGEGHPSAVEA